MNNIIKKTVLYVISLIVIFFGNKLYMLLTKLASLTYTGGDLFPIMFVLYGTVFFLVLERSRINNSSEEKKMVWVNIVTAVISVIILLLLLYWRHLGHLTNIIYLMLLVTVEDVFDLVNSITKNCKQ